MQSTYRLFLFCIILMLSTALPQAIAQTANNATINFTELPSIPDAFGFAGSFAGISNGTLLVAGGANFPDGGTPWTGSKKVWHDDVFALESPSGQWKKVGKLPKPLAYGASITTKDGLLIIGGSDEKKHHSSVYLLKYVNGSINYDTLHDLPSPIANTTGILIGHVVYIAGGTSSPDARVATNNFWALDLNEKNKGFKTLPSWPGQARMLALCGASGEAFYLFSGANLNDGQRTYLKDAYRYHPEQGWKALADLPQAVLAAPSPAYTKGQHLIVFGGDDGELASKAATLKENHPGFSKKILSYDVLSNQWATAGFLSITAPVTTTLTIWNNNVVIPGGEIRPAVRTPKVFTYSPKDNEE